MTFSKIYRQIIKKIGLFHQKGSSHFTIMMIPNSEKKIFSFQISNYTMGFFAIILFFSIYSIYHYSANEELLTHRLNIMQEKNEQYWEHYREVDRLIGESCARTEELEEEMDRLYKIIGEGNFNFPDRGTHKYLQKKYALSHPLPDNLYSFFSARETLRSLDLILVEMEKILNVRRTMVSHLPIHWPVYGDKSYKTSDFGKRYSPFEGRYQFHTGVDIAAYPRTPVVAAAEGKVIFVGIKSGYGHTVILKHNKYGFGTLYGHNSRILVKVGEYVRAGQKIALLGRSGKATGYHLHFEVRIDNKPVDPWPYISTTL